MKILVLNYEFPPIGGGGGAVARDLAQALSARGHQIQVQTARWDDLPKCEDRDGYRIHRSFSFRRRADRCSVPEMGAFIVCNLIPTLNRVHQFKPDLIHAHFAAPTGVVAKLISSLTGIPYVLTLHLGDVPGAMPGQTDHLFRVLKPLLKPVWRGAAHITAVSEWLAQLARDAYGLPVTTIPNGVQLPADPPRAEAGEGPIKLLYVGRFDPQKNLPFLLEALTHLNSSNWHCTLAGDGPEAATLHQMRDGFGLTDRLDMPGWVSRDTVDQLMRESHVLLMPSLFEGLPVAAVHGLSHGLAIVGSPIGGLRDVIQHNVTGLSLSIDHPQTFAAQLDALISDRPRLTQMRHAARNHARRFDLTRVIDAYETVFHQLLTTRS